MSLGATTDSQDADGQILETKPVASFTRGRDRKAHLPNMMVTSTRCRRWFPRSRRTASPLYKLARQGKVVEREPRFVHVFAHEIREMRPTEIDFRVVCSKGFYVRTYAHDIGNDLGCGAHLKGLRRTKSGRFNLRTRSDSRATCSQAGTLRDS